MDFPIVELLDDELASEWLLSHVHPKGLSCPHCETSVKEARDFRETKTSKLVVHRCLDCDGIYNLYSGTVFQHKQLSPAQVVLLRGVCKGESSASIGREIGITRQAVMSIRREIQQNAEAIQPSTPLDDRVTETDEMFQNAKKKRPASQSSRPTQTTC